MMMHATMMMQAMMQLMVDGGVHDITSHFSDEFHKELPWLCLDIACERLSFFPWHLISS
jgi:hypothetical protein